MVAHVEHEQAHEQGDAIFSRSRPEALSEHLADFLAMRPPPKLVWLQLGIRHAAVKEALIAAGIDVVEDRCALADHRALVASRG